MVTVAVLSADQRLSFQIHTWLKDVAEEIRWETHADVAAFAHKIETENAAELIEKSKSGDEDILDAEDIGSGKSKQSDDAYYRLLIVDLDLLNLPGPQAADWARQLKKQMLEKQRSDPMFPVRILFLAFEGGGVKVDSYSDEAIDDLILKPLDRSVFLQKIEIMTADDPSIKPTFLFRQKTNITIEIGKDAVIEEISEFSIAIRNPAPLANGVFAAIHCSAFGQADLARVIGRVYKTQPHPSEQGKFLVRFLFYGLRGDQHANIKKYVRDRQPPAKAKPPQIPMSDQDPAVPFNRVAVVDMDPDVFADVQSAMKDHFVGVATSHYISYARLLAALKEFFPETSQLNVVPPAPAEALDDTHEMKAWTSPGPLKLVVDSATQELVRFETALASGDTVLGRTRLEWNERPSEFFQGLDKQDANEMQEMVSYAVSGGKGRAHLRMKDDSKRLYYVEAQAVLAKSVEDGEAPQILIELKQIEKAEYLQRSNATEKKIEPGDLLYDAIFIDVNLIRGELQPWFDGLQEAYLKAGILTPGVPMPKIILLADEKSRTKPDDYRNKVVSDYLYKPLDRKMMSFKAKIAVTELIPRKEPEIPPFVRVELPAKLAKDVQMEELSEYGLSIAHPTAFRRGSMVRFFSPLLGGGVDGVLGRCTHCEQKEEKDVSYLCHFMFFGTPDEILKRIRTWIREDYVHRKEAP